MASEPGTETTPARIRLDISGSSIATVLVAILGALLATGLVVASRRIISWVVACAVVAALIELAASWLDRYMSRVVAIVFVLLMIAGAAGALTYLVTNDLDQEVRRLQIAAPEAARDIETSSRFRNTASEVNLEERVTAAVERLRAPSSGLAGDAVASVGTYTVCAILTILFLSWGPRLARGGLSQLDPSQQERVRHIGELAFQRARRYISLAIAQSLFVGLIGFAVCKLNDLPAPAPLALGLAVMALIPNIGIVLGSLPILLLSIGLAPTNDARLTIGFFVVLQVVSAIVLQPRIVRISKLYVGPAIISIAFLAGFELYGIGGALYAAALFVFATAALDAVDESEHDTFETTTELIETAPVTKP